MANDLDRLKELEKKIVVTSAEVREFEKLRDLMMPKFLALVDAAQAVEKMLNIEEGYEGYVDTHTAALLAEALESLRGSDD